MKYLISADLHLHAFVSHSLYPGFRLDQFRWVAQWWAELVNFYQLDAVLVAGDFFHIPTPPPEVLGVAIDFVKRIPAPLVVVHGQHDLDARSQLQEARVKSQALLQILPHVREAIHYLHQEWLQLGTDRIYGFGWHPQHAWPQLDSPADLLLTHGSVRGARFGKILASEGFDPQTLPARIAFIGDIHQHQQVGAIHIPGPPIHHSFSDSSCGVLLYDSQTGRVERISSGKVGSRQPWKFLQFQFGDREGFDPEERIFYRQRRPEQREIWKHQLERASWDLRGQLQEALPPELKPLHQQFISGLPLTAQLPELNFELETITLKNFRSISELSLEFGSERVWLLTGPNGSGKSTLLEALRYVLLGARSGAELVRKGAESMSVTLQLRYAGNQYQIERGFQVRNYLRIWCQGVELDSASLRSKETKLEELFPWIPWLDQLGLFTQFRLGLMAPLSQRERLEWFARIFGLDLVQNLYQAASAERSRLRSQLEDRLQQLQRMAPNEELLRQLEAKWPQHRELSDWDESQLQALQAQLKALRLDWSQDQKTLRILEAQSRASQDKISELQAALIKLRSARCPTCGQLLHAEGQAQLLDDYNQRLQSEVEKLQRVRGAVEASEERLKTLETHIHALEGELGERSSYLQLATEIRTLRQALQSWKSAQAQLEEEMNALKGDLQQLEHYLEFVSPRSPLLQKAMEAVSSQLSEEGWEVKTYRLKRSGEIEPDFSLARKLGDHLVDYDSLSGGQRLKADLYLLKKILNLLGGIGFLAFDETLRVLDAQARSEAAEWLSQLPARHLWIVSHDAEVPEYDLLLQFSLDSQGLTQLERLDA